MHHLTKILAVFASVLCVVLSTLSIAYVSNTNRILSDYQRERNRASMKAVALTAQQTRHDEQLANLQRQLTESNSALSRMKLQRDQTEDELAQLRAAKFEAEATGQQFEANLNSLTAAVSTQTKVNELQQDELRELRSNEVRATKREIELADRVNDLQSLLEVAEETNRALEEAVAEYRLASQARDAGGALLSGGAAAFGQTVRASITALTAESSGAILVSINAGSSDGLQAGSELTIVQNGNFAGKLTLIEAQRNTSTGLVDTLNSGVDIAVGDRVQSISVVN